jgi:hypothetical protein
MTIYLLGVVADIVIVVAYSGARVEGIESVAPGTHTEPAVLSPTHKRELALYVLK